MRSAPSLATSSATSYRLTVAKILIVSDAKVVIDEVRAGIDDGSHEISSLSTGQDVRPYVSADAPDLVITDSQIKNMGGMAICMDLKLEESGDRLPFIPVLILLDRRADVFHRSSCAGAARFLGSKATRSDPAQKSR